MKRRREGRLFVLSSPSGGGKTSIGEVLSRKVPRLVRSISVTTRRPRRGEKEGRDYFFVSESAFQAMSRRGDLLEWTRYGGHAYGTPRRKVEEVLARGKDLLLLLDVRGALTLKKRMKRAVTIFVMPPSLRELANRLGRRKTEGRRDIARRLQIAKRELTYTPRYDHVVVNDRLSKAIETIRQIVRQTRSREKS